MLGSGIVFLRLFSTPVVVLNTAKVAQDLFEKRSNRYSARSVSLIVLAYDFC